MARFSDSCYGDSPGRPQKGLSLSTGRFEGRPVAAPKNGSRANAHSSSTRHNPLRDEYPSSHERRYRSEIDYPPDKRRSFRFEDESRPEELPSAPAVAAEETMRVLMAPARSVYERIVQALEGWPQASCSQSRLPPSPWRFSTSAPSSPSQWSKTERSTSASKASTPQVAPRLISPKMPPRE